MKESIFRASLRSFFVSLFAFVGVCLGLLVILIVFGAAFGDGGTEIESSYSPIIQPNAKGVRKVMPDSAPVILKVNVSGFIGAPRFNRHTLGELLVESREGKLKKDRVKGVILSINTPGGGAIDADGMYNLLKEYKKRYDVPVYAYVDGICASGGMYIAASADKVIASETSILGSVGVILSPFFNVTELMEKVGITSKTLSMGKGKDSMSPFRNWKEGEDDNYREIIEQTYQNFVDVIVENRPNVSREKLIKVYGAQIFSASQAKEIGLVDEQGLSYEEALQQLVEQLGIHDDHYQVMQLEDRNWMRDLLSSENGWLKGEIKHRIQLGSEMGAELLNQPLLLHLSNQ